MLIAHHQSADDMQPYERLLGDAARGDPELFARADSVEAEWRIVDPILGNATPLYEYEPNTWGPAEVDHSSLRSLDGTTRRPRRRREQSYGETFGVARFDPHAGSRTMGLESRRRP